MYSFDSCGSEPRRIPATLALLTSRCLLTTRMRALTASGNACGLESAASRRTFSQDFDDPANNCEAPAVESVAPAFSVGKESLGEPLGSSQRNAGNSAPMAARFHGRI